VSVRSLRVAVTGGSSSGKSYLTKLAQVQFPDTYSCVPEVASVVLLERQVDQTSIDRATRESVQLEIYRRQVAQEESAPIKPITLCDRGTIDASSYWPSGPELFWRAAASTVERELERYGAVIWLESAAAVGCYQQNPVRTEGAEESRRHGELLKRLWCIHRRLFAVSATNDFQEKVRAFFSILERIRAELA
jgi:predicted ATPase